MINNGWFLGLEALAVSIFTTVIRRVWPRSDPNAKRLAHLERRVEELSKQFGIEDAPMTGVQELIVQGRKINAIKLHREQTRASLAASKEAVDTMEAQMMARSLA